MNPEFTCPYCGKEIFEGDEFCLYCGKRLKATKRNEKKDPAKRSKKTSFGKVLIKVLLWICCLGIAVGLPVLLHLNERKAYDEAKELFVCGRYSEAVTAFTALGDFGDAAALAERAQKLLDKESALSGIDTRQPEAVLSALLETGGYIGISDDIQAVFDRINREAREAFVSANNRAGALMAEAVLSADTALSAGQYPETSEPEPAPVPIPHDDAAVTNEITPPPSVRPEATPLPAEKNVSVAENTKTADVVPSLPPEQTAVPEPSATPAPVAADKPAEAAQRTAEPTAVPAVTQEPAPIAVQQTTAAPVPKPTDSPNITAVPADTPAPITVFSPKATPEPTATPRSIEDEIREAKLAALYDLAMESFRQGLFYTAKQQFLELGDFRESAAMAADCSLPLPATGELYRKSGLKKSGSALFITNEAGMPVVYCVYDTADELLLTLFVRTGDEVKAMLPAGLYQLKEGRGTEWYGTNEFFGNDGYYCIVKNESGSRYYAIEDGYGYDFLVHNRGTGDDETVSMADF